MKSIDFILVNFSQTELSNSPCQILYQSVREMRSWKTGNFYRRKLGNISIQNYFVFESKTYTNTQTRKQFLNNLILHSKILLK